MTHLRRLTLIGLFLTFFVAVQPAAAADPFWTHVDGSGDYIDEFGVYNDPDPANNHPGSRTDSVTWTDTSGNLWLFGGRGYSAAESDVLLNDLWKFDPASGNWTFVKGSGGYADEYGVYNDPAAANNHPGSREKAVSWVYSGSLWLFGGYGYAASGSIGALNDVWKFDPASGNWTFVKGSGDYVDEFGVYNNPNLDTNLPGSRYSASGMYLNGRFWLFGGIGSAASPNTGVLNDLWNFNPFNGRWTFVKGSGDFVDEYGIYTDPTPANNLPGSRFDAVTWADNGNLWVFGGNGMAASSQGQLNDLWKYNTSTSRWTFVSGTGDFVDELSVYNDPDPANNHPGSHEGSASWIDHDGNLWMFGGLGYGASSNGSVNHLWRFDRTYGSWTFFKGSGDYVDEFGVYNDPTPANNLPGSRTGAVTWATGGWDADFWVFGGEGGGAAPNWGTLNDLWKFELPSHTLTFEATGSGTGTVGFWVTYCSITAGVPSGTCSETLPLGTHVTLEAQAGDESAFTGWSGCPKPDGNFCHFDYGQDLTVTANFAFTHQEVFEWATHAVGGEVTSVGTDASGSVYTTGGAFIAKSNSAGASQWAVEMVGAVNGVDEANARDLIADSSGNLTVGGYFEGTVDFDPGPGTYNLTAIGSYDPFVVRLDSSGTFQWAARIDGQWDYDGLEMVAADEAGNAFVTGGFSGTVDFDPGPGTFNLTSTGSTDTFLLKLDNTGAFQWVVGGGNSDHAVAADGAGGAYFTTYTSGIRKIIKVDSGGTALWSIDLSGSVALIESMAVDAEGNLVAAGEMEGDVTLNHTAGSVNYNEAQTMMVLKFDSSGALLWDAVGDGPDTWSWIHGIALDPAGNIYLTGLYSDTVDFDLGSSLYSITTPSYENAFIWKLADDGEFEWAHGWKVGNTFDIAINASGDLYVIGSEIGSTVDLDPGIGIYNLPAGDDTFLLKLHQTISEVLSVEGAGTGSGTITATGIICTITAGTESGDCSESAAVGTVMTLTAAASAESGFKDWAGCDSTSGTNGEVCEVTLTSDTTVTATFGDKVWTFVKGSGDYLDEPAVYNDPNPANNTPGSRMFAASWTDGSGNFWLFGGIKDTGSGSSSLLNDLWKYDPTTDIWTFIKGSGDFIDEFGVYNDPNPASNHPGSRMGTVAWIDSAGNLWLFGGGGYGESDGAGVLNDLWKFDPTSGNWTLVKGFGDYVDESPVHDDPNPANNHPGSQYQGVSWIDASDNLWLFSGEVANSVVNNNLWKFDPNTGNWTLVKGNYGSGYGVYDDPDPANNRPGERNSAVSWMGADGSLWLFGGQGVAQSGSLAGDLNDLWKFDPVTGNWTFVKGIGDYVDEFGIYNDPDPANNRPGSRYGAASWTDADGSLWLFSGAGYGEDPDPYPTDLWKFDPTSGTWTFVKGSGMTEFGVYDDPNPANNHPGFRSYASSWMDGDGNLWLFGGHGYAASGSEGYLNDLWKFEIGDPILIIAGAGAGNGTVTGTGITCTITASTESGDCSQPDTTGAVFTLTASPSSDSTFEGWTGCDSTSGTNGEVCEVTLGAYTTVTAQFDLIPTYTLTVEGAGSGNGTISGTDITCTSAAGTESGDCAETALTGTAFTLTAESTNGFFVGWSGCDSTSGANSEVCHITLSADTTVTATFDLDPAALNATSASPTQIDLTWADNGSAETGYSIERSPDGVSGWTEIATTAANATSYPDTGQLCGGWFYRVRAVYAGGLYSAYTNIDGASCDIFDDVPETGKEWMMDWIDLFYTSGITGGCGANPLVYCPERKVTRAEMAVFLVRAYHYPSLPHTPTDQGGTFADVPVLGKEWMEDWIEEFFDLGITGGCMANPLRFCPERQVTRAEMAVFILRALEGGDYQPPAADHYFDDVPVAGKEWMEAWIDEFYRRGITTGCGVAPLQFCPEREVTRAEMAVFILRAFDSLPKP